MSDGPRKESALDLLARAMMTGSEKDAIRGQEADGQKALVKSSTLPTEISDEGRSALEAAGVKFLGVVENDPLFQRVELPAGWKKDGSGHSMWTNLLDDKGRKRASIFYKAASYDRRAHMSVVSRFSTTLDYDKLEEHIAEAIVQDGLAEIYRTPAIAFSAISFDSESDAKEAATLAARTWLTENFPDWKNSSAYWD